MFSKRNRKHVLCFFWVIETLVKVWENWKNCGNTRLQLVVFPQHFLFSQTSTRVSITWLACIAAVSFPFWNTCEGDKNCERVQRISSRSLRGWGKRRNHQFHSSPPPPPCRSPPLPFSVFCHPRCTHPSLARSVSPHKEKETAAIQAITCYSSPLNLHQFLLV